MTDCRLGVPRETVEQVEMKKFPKTIDETWEIINTNKDGLMKIIASFGGNNKATVAEEMIRNKNKSFHSLMNKIWCEAPEDWYALHRFACWELLCDLISDGVFYE